MALGVARPVDVHRSRIAEQHVSVEEPNADELAVVGNTVLDKVLTAGGWHLDMVVLVLDEHFLLVLM